MKSFQIGIATYAHASTNFDQIKITQKRNELTNRGIGIGLQNI